MTTKTPEVHLLGLFTRYSSWTARVEAVLEYFQIPYTYEYMSLAKVKAMSPTGMVPVLITPNLPKAIITDSLSICEYLAETNPTLPLWPRDPFLRALARSAAAHMHSNFPILRSHFPTNFLALYTGDVPISDRAKVEICAMLRLWDEARARTKERIAAIGGEDEGFLFGGFSIADAFFWPVLWRFRSYGLPVDEAGPDALEWMARMWNDPVFKKLGEWYFLQAEEPRSTMPQYDDVFRGRENVQYGLIPRDWTFSVPG